jgi:hypothetical protein
MDILVYADWEELEAPTNMGVLSVIHTRGHAVFTIKAKGPLYGGPKTERSVFTSEQFQFLPDPQVFDY